MLMNMKDLLEVAQKNYFAGTCFQYRKRPAVKGCYEKSEGNEKPGYSGNEPG